ncbi:MAG TPA: acetoin utilization protein AcuC [Marmoricola sp.]|jgi:acetoin utilization protein AcuC|nr:acetoin utilization protein AcuC [Marmoricola sp.]
MVVGGCGGESCVVYDESLTAYDFGPEHPMNPIRVDLTVRLADSLGVIGPDRLVAVPAPDAADLDLLTVHRQSLLDAVERSSVDPMLIDLAHGLGTEDNPTFLDMHRAARHVVGASMEAARRVWAGEAVHAANIAGGLHHALPTKASGFCVYNDVGVAIKWLLANGARRVAYVDVDAHHGDGVQQIFYDDPRVLTISLHETGQMLFPGTGFPNEFGGPHAQGSAVNVALPPGTADAGWLRAFHAVVPPLVREFAPDILVTQQGCDSHRDDPLAHLMLSVDGQRASYLALHDLAHEVAGGRWVAFGGGGYAVVDVVPRAWTHLLAVVSGQPLEPGLDVPAEWRADVAARLGRRAPLLMTDGREPAYRDWSEGYNPDTWLDRAVQATRDAVFPLNGLDPML